MDNKDIKILLVEDDPDDALLIREALFEVDEPTLKFKLDCVETLQAGFQRIIRGNVDAILLDLSLPDSQGLDTFLRTHSQFPAVPIIVLTGLDDKTLGLEALWQGAQDYLVKGRIDSKMLLRVIRYAIERNRMQSEMRTQSLID